MSQDLSCPPKMRNSGSLPAHLSPPLDALRFKYLPPHLKEPAPTTLAYKEYPCVYVPPRPAVYLQRKRIGVLSPLGGSLTTPLPLVLAPSRLPLTTVNSHCQSNCQTTIRAPDHTNEAGEQGQAAAARAKVLANKANKQQQAAGQRGQQATSPRGSHAGKSIGR
jgi:hypothetical protein